MKALLIFSLLGVVLLPPEFVHASPSPADSLHFSTFTSTAGDGTLSGRFTLERATTGADGRAQGVLTLGRDQGTNTFEATVPGLELLTFNAVGVGTPSNPEMEGDFQRWHLPPGAILRLGKGRIGTGDRVVVFSPDGLLLAVGSEIGVWLYEVATSGELALLPAAPVAAVAFAPDGAMLASAGSYGDRTVKLWDVATATLLETIDLEADALAFSPDGTTLACGSNYGIDLWDLATGTRTATISHEQNAWGINSLAFSPDGTTLASGSWSDYFVRLWDVTTATHTASLDGHANEVESVAFSPDGTTLASGSRDRTVRLWDVATGVNSATLEGHTGFVYSVAFSPDGTTVASGSWDDAVRLWDVATGANTASSEVHSGRVYSVAFSPEGTTIAFGSTSDGTVRLWDVATGDAHAFAKGHKGCLNTVAFSPDGTTIASGYDHKTIELWNVATGASTAVLEGHNSIINDVSFSPDGTILASGSSDNTVKLWDVATGANTATLDTRQHRSWVGIVAFSPDGTRIASGQGNGIAKLWDTATGTNAATLRGHTNPVSVLAFSPDGTVLATGEGPDLVTETSSAPMVKLWDVASGTNTATFELPTDSIISLWFTPDGRPIASGGLGGWPSETVELWNLADNTLIATLSFEELWVYSMMVFSGTDVDQIDLFEVRGLASGTYIATLGAHRGLITGTVFSRDGRTFASSSGNGTILLWDTKLFLPHPRTLIKFSGDDQQSPAGAALTKPLVVMVHDQYGNPLPGAIVTFAVTAGGGSLSATTATTDAEGRAAVTLTLGSDPGRNTVAAKVAELKPVIFGATGKAIPRTLAKLSGDEQEGPAGTALAEPFVVEVRNQDNNPLEGAQVTFAITAGGGTLSATTATTDANGRASSTLTLGTEPGTNVVAAIAAELDPVTFTASGAAIPKSLTKISGDEQEAPAGASLVEPFVAEVRDLDNNPLADVQVTFAVTAGSGTLSVTTATTDADGRASTTLTLGLTGANTVTVSVAGLESITFTGTAKATPDFDGDGETGFSDFFLFADAFGGSDPRFDLDGSGSVDFGDFFLLADHFGDPARGKLLALAREMIGLPYGPQLQQNVPNPFNSETVISWFLLRPGPVRVEVFALTGQRVAVLTGKAGVHRVHWDGRDDRGRHLASGVYLYRLVTDERVHTRKLTLLR